MCIVTGPNIEIATKLIKGLKGIFDTKSSRIFNDKETVLQVHGYSIEVYRSNHLDDFKLSLQELIGRLKVKAGGRVCHKPSSPYNEPV